MSRQEKTPPLVTFAILSVITVFVWVGFETYRTFTKEPSPTVPLEVTKALDPSLNEEVLGKVVDRIELEESEIGDTDLTPIATPQPEATVEPSTQDQVILEETPNDAI